MKRYAYEIVVENFRNGAMPENADRIQVARQRLNELGAQGWRVISTVLDPNGTQQVIWTLERAAEESAYRG